jgi:hypothetical protein
MKKEERDHSRCSRRHFIKNAITGIGTIALGSFSVSLKAYSRECTHQQCAVGPFINCV